MINQQVLEGNWNQLKGKLQEKWGQLSESDVSEFRGNVDELIGKIQRKTGAGREAIENYLQNLTENASTMMGQATESARQYMHQATESVRGSARFATDQLQEGFSGAQDMVRERPGQALAICFGAGLLVGLAIAATWHSR
jgi:uncharacterized protein YjbJ (UPF0337 family)